MFQNTTATQKIFQLTKRIRAVAGGTSASKTISILIWLIDYAQSTENKLISIVSESYPHLEKGAMLDFQNIMMGQGYWEDVNWHGTKHQYTFSTGSVIEFMSVDTYGKAHGPRRDVLFVNECNHLPYKIVDQLITRTREIIWLDWNPSEEFWFYTEMLPNRTDIDFITLTYLDNEALDPVSRAEIEMHRNNKAWWTVYGLGQLGEIEGRIFTNWAIIDDVPHEAKLVRRYLDFGYSVDPSAIGDIYYLNGGYIIDEQLYQKGMSNKQLADFLGNLPENNMMVKADSAEPKSIDEIKSYGINIVPCQKGHGSVNQSIQHVQEQKISVTKRSVNIIKEYRAFMWETDRDGNFTKNPTEGMDHHMSGIRYGFEGLGDRFSIHREKPHYVLVGGDPVTGFGRRRVKGRKSIEAEMNGLFK